VLLEGLYGADPSSPPTLRCQSRPLGWAVVRPKKKDTVAAAALAANEEKFDIGGEWGDGESRLVELSGVGEVGGEDLVLRLSVVSA
jgi:hypothetical protein